MEPLTTTKMIGAAVGYLAQTLKDNKPIQEFFNDFTAATVQWIRPVFLKEDNKYEKIIEDLIKNPDSPIKRQQVETAIASHLEDAPEDIANLEVMYGELLAKLGKEGVANIVNITGDNNKVYQGIHNSTITDNSVTQTHSGTGDNVAGGKKVYNIKKIDNADFS